MAEDYMKYAPKTAALYRRLLEQRAGGLNGANGANGVDGSNAEGHQEEADIPLIEGLRQAADGEWYLPDPNRKGKYLQVVMVAKK